MKKYPINIATKTIISFIFSPFSIMQFCMFRSTYKLKIFNSIIKSTLINMMYSIKRINKFSTNMLLHNITVFKHYSSFYTNFLITFVSNISKTKNSPCSRSCWTPKKSFSSLMFMTKTIAFRIIKTIFNITLFWFSKLTNYITKFSTEFSRAFSTFKKLFAVFTSKSQFIIFLNKKPRITSQVIGVKGCPFEFY